MTKNEFLLEDRKAKIQAVIGQYGEDNFYLSFSGGKDSTVLHNLLDLALPGNRIPRVYAHTGIELNMVRDFVLELQKNDDRIVVIKPSVPIKPMLEKEGYPFKSKYHSMVVDIFQKHGIERSETVKNYLNLQIPKSGIPKWSDHTCPKILRYQFEPEFTLKISDKCCDRMKKDPLHKWQKENNRPFAIIGIMASEGGAAGNRQMPCFQRR